MKNATSPASSGPAGSHFEGRVGASYLLSLLVGAEPRGLPGTIIDRVAFQRAAEGHPLDDVVVYAHDVLGEPYRRGRATKLACRIGHSWFVFSNYLAHLLPGFWAGSTSPHVHPHPGLRQHVLQEAVVRASA